VHIILNLSCILFLCVYAVQILCSGAFTMALQSTEVPLFAVVEVTLLANC